jgi:hypothetical protein
LLVLGASAADLAKAIRSDHLSRRSRGSARGHLKIRRDFDAPLPKAVLQSFK